MFILFALACAPSPLQDTAAPDSVDLVGIDWQIRRSDSTPWNTCADDVDCVECITLFDDGTAEHRAALVGDDWPGDLADLGWSMAVDNPGDWSITIDGIGLDVVAADAYRTFYPAGADYFVATPGCTIPW